MRDNQSEYSDQTFFSVSAQMRPDHQSHILKNICHQQPAPTTEWTEFASLNKMYKKGCKFIKSFATSE